MYSWSALLCASSSLSTCGIRSPRLAASSARLLAKCVLGLIHLQCRYAAACRLATVTAITVTGSQMPRCRGRGSASRCRAAEVVVVATSTSPSSSAVTARLLSPPSLQ